MSHLKCESCGVCATCNDISKNVLNKYAFKRIYTCASSGRGSYEETLNLTEQNQAAIKQ